MAVVFKLTVLGGAGFLALAVWPGVLEVTLFSIPFCAVTLSVLAFWFLLPLVVALLDLTQKRDSLAERRRWGLWSSAVMFATLGLLWFHVPQRVALALCSSELQELADTARADEYRGRELDRWFGPYRVDRYGADQRGGVFFRTHTGPDGIGPDQMSYGFAFRPNGQGTPFGNSAYRQHHLFGDWYAFAASDD